LGILLLTES